MKQSRNTLSPVVIGALFTLALAGCGATQEPTDTPPVSDGSSSSETMQSSKPADSAPASSSPSDTMSSSKPSDSAPASSSRSAMTTSEAAVVPKQRYADGTFAASGEYRSPAGGETVNVSLTLKNGIVANGSVQGTATNPRSINFQNAFAAGFEQAVVGKSINSLNLDVVNGSSLTPMGFMDALAKIKAEAAVKA